MKQKNTGKAELILTKLLGEIKKEKLETYTEIESGVYLRFSELYTMQGNVNQALYYIKEHQKLKIALLEKSYNFELAKIQNESELSKLDTEIKLLNVQNNSKSIKLGYQRRILFFLFFASALFIGLSIFLLKLNLDKRKLNTSLVKRNLELAKQIPFQEIKNKINEVTDIELIKYKEIINELIGLFEVDKIYLQNDISLTEVAAQLNTNRTYLSKAIHDVLDTNFNSLINKYRVEQARKMLSDPHQKLSIEGIANSVGFNSKSTFNIAFKTFTGLTPSILRNEVNLM